MNETKPSSVEAPLRRPSIYYEDPLRLHLERAQMLRAILDEATNYAGDDVMVGDNVVLWGGRFPGGVGLQLGNNVRLYDQCRLVIDHASPQSGIVLEERVAMNFGCYLDGSGGIRVGARTIFGPNVVVVSSQHRIDASVVVQDSGKSFKPVDIGKNVWIGGNAVIMAGVTIGDGSVVGAGSVVTRDVPARCVVAGNPATFIRAIEA